MQQTSNASAANSRAHSCISTKWKEINAIPYKSVLMSKAKGEHTLKLLNQAICALNGLGSPEWVRNTYDSS